nr:transporter substrate-binding domain-containing protein [uncultured Ruegeria sp.]
MRTFGFATLAVLLPPVASAQEACTTYITKKGDTLGSIAKAAYDSFDYQNIFNANRDTLVGNPNEIAVGTSLVLPCLDGRLNFDSELNAISEKEQAKHRDSRNANALYEPPVKFVTIDDWAPFADEELLGGGIMTRLAQTALRRGGNDRDSEFFSINDSAAQIDILVPTGAMDFTSAWMVPDCAKLDLLSPASARMCTEFDATLPAYEVAITYVTLTDNAFAAAKTYDDFISARMCRPEGWETHMLEEQGLSEPTVTMVRARTSMDCAQAVLDGTADVFVAEIELAVDHFEDLGAADQVAYNQSLVEVSAFRYIIAKSNPRARVYIAMVNRGLTEMRETGEWYDIVSSSLADFNKSRQ